ncbi:MAG: hypothetical protein GTO45_14480 [Candidatus Aminicenantes bacterium]|nr:hypothetical protein [Candidatus Aminicenantes bacterium]NIM79973.1 hypothetical protein [Candidatus Aminicenantes bacterium]NIN19312.1 hypothetical protein [Candidatus Aminicenantes bacterium]NIN43215.1 hypothetical protein [Candidatus Aminicenantes bacterium]NIN85954.1 hypothetical protein [Candidatus Aminicenantes bacterium]
MIKNKRVSAIILGLVFLIFFLGFTQSSLLSNEYKDAKKAYEKGHIDYALNLLITKLKKDNDHKKAVELFKTVINLVIPLHLKAAQDYEAKKNWIGALNEYDKLLKIKHDIASINPVEKVKVEGKNVKRPINMPEIDIDVQHSNSFEKATKQNLYLKKLKSYNKQTRLDAAKNLLELVGAEATANYIRKMGSSQRCNSVITLGDMKDSTFVIPISKIFLNDTDTHVRFAASRALGKINDSRAVEPLIKVLLNDKSVFVKRGAAESLGMLKDPRAVNPLRNEMKSTSDSKIKDIILSALIEINDPGCSDIYIKALTSKNSETRLKAAKIVLNLKDNPKALEVKNQALKIIKYEESYITSEILFDPRTRPIATVLKNLKGKIIAKKIPVFSKFNTKIITEERIFDVVTNKTIHITKYEYGKPINPLFLCLDEKGNIIKKSGKPILIKSFYALQQIKSKKKYSTGFLIEEIRKIYPCENCAEQTGIKNCRYVW